MLSGIVFANGSLILGWGGLGFYSVGHQLAVAILLSIEVILARLLESTDQGVKTVARQDWLGLAGILWLIMNFVLARSASRRELASAGGVWISWAGTGLLAGGLTLRVWSAWTLGRFFSLRVTVFDRHELIVSGPYRYCRHPAYLGSLLQVVGLILAFQSVAGLIFLIVFIPLVFWRIYDEEALLAVTFPHTYAGYRRRVPLLFPSGGFRRIGELL